MLEQICHIALCHQEISVDLISTITNKRSYTVTRRGSRFYEKMFYQKIALYMWKVLCN